MTQSLLVGHNLLICAISPKGWEVPRYTGWLAFFPGTPVKCLILLLGYDDTVFPVPSHVRDSTLGAFGPELSHARSPPNC